MRLLSALMSMLLLAGVAHAADPRDPWEGFNRKMFAFNETLDRYITKPLALGYRAVTPDFADRAVTRFFANLHDVADVPNFALQGDLPASRDSLLRVIGNTTVGLGGLLDPAGSGGIANRDTDFGDTLGKWGVGSGNYLVLPFVGPSTVRDTAGMPVDMAFHPLPLPWTVIDRETVRIPVVVLDLVDTRADLLDLEQAVVGDRYGFLRDIYLQKRDYKVNGAPASDPFLDDSFEEEVPPASE
ncbi:MAG: MlaA family lipoprotein [Pseudomonadota bacterium]